MRPKKRNSVKISCFLRNFCYIITARETYSNTRYYIDIMMTLIALLREKVVQRPALYANSAEQAKPEVLMGISFRTCSFVFAVDEEWPPLLQQE